MPDCLSIAGIGHLLLCETSAERILLSVFGHGKFERFQSRDGGDVKLGLSLHLPK
jgi:hypothetical protein